MIKTKDIWIRDPFVLPVEEEGKYYLFGTTGKSAWGGVVTGFDVYVGTDLENWEGPFPAFRPELDFWADENFWAPEVHKYNNRYFMFASFKTEGKCRGTQILVADDPIGPYRIHSEQPVTPCNWECLDGTLYIDRNEKPWMVFCHEWLQVVDGEMCAVKLSEDLKKPEGEPILLFHASDAPWSRPNTGSVTSNLNLTYVTDGPFLYRSTGEEIIMLWSSFTDAGYAIGIARSESGEITGPWKHDLKPIDIRDGGHGMLFYTFEGQLKLSIHAPNNTPNERPVFIDIAF